MLLHPGLLRLVAFVKGALLLAQANPLGAVRMELVVFCPERNSCLGCPES